MTAIIDLFFSFRSPYSYLATPGAMLLEHDFDVEIRLRPVLPLAVRQPSFFDEANRQRMRYIQLDWERRAAMLGMPHAWPAPDPIVQDLATLQIAAEQPYIFRLTYLGVEAERRGRGIEFAREVSHLIFGGMRDWHLGSHLADAAARAGLDLAAMDATIADADSQRHIVEGNQQALAAAGHWGVPTFVLAGEPYFGQDRIDTLRWQLDSLGLRRPVHPDRVAPPA